MFQRLLKEEGNFKWHNILIIDSLRPELIKALPGPTIIHIDDWQRVEQLLPTTIRPHIKSITMCPTIISPLPTLIIEPTNNTIMPLRIKNIDVLTKYSQHEKYSQKELLKLLLFNRYDAKQRVAIPYTMAQCLGKMEETQLLFEENPCIPNKITDFFIKFEKQSSAVNNIFRYLRREPEYSYHVYVGSRNLNILSNLNKKCHFDVVPPFLRKILIRYVNYSEIKQKQRTNALKSTIQHLKTAYEAKKCLNLILQEVQTFYISHLQQQKYTKTLEKYIKSLNGYENLKKQRLSKDQLTTISKYISSFKIFQQFDDISQHASQHKIENVVKIQKYVKCFMLRRYRTRQLELEFLKQQNLQITEEKHLLQELLNKNNQAKPYQKLAFIQIQVLSIDIMKTRMATNLKHFLKSLIKDMKQEERVNNLSIADGWIQIKTNKRVTSYGVGNHEETVFQTTTNKHPRLNDNLILDMEETPHGTLLLLDNKTIIDQKTKKIIFKESSNSLMPYQLINLTSNSTNIILIKKLNFCQTNLNLALKKQIVKQASRHKNKHNLFKIPYSQEMSAHLIERIMPKPLHPKDNTLEETNLLLDLPADNELTFSL